LNHALNLINLWYQKFSLKIPDKLQTVRFEKNPKCNAGFYEGRIRTARIRPKSKTENRRESPFYKNRRFTPRFAPRGAVINFSFEYRRRLTFAVLLKDTRLPIPLKEMIEVRVSCGCMVSL
jgi:hypothetical protein